MRILGVLAVMTIVLAGPVALASGTCPVNKGLFAETNPSPVLQSPIPTLQTEDEDVQSAQ